MFDGCFHAEGLSYRAQVCGTQTDGIWEGWIEFIPTQDGDERRSPRETTQPNRDALAYWATGLSPTYLEGALKRALEPALRLRQPVAAAAYFEEPAP